MKTETKSNFVIKLQLLRSSVTKGTAKCTYLPHKVERASQTRNAKQKSCKTNFKVFGFLTKLGIEVTASVADLLRHYQLFLPVRMSNRGEKGRPISSKRTIVLNLAPESYTRSRQWPQTRTEVETAQLPVLLMSSPLWRWA